MAKRPTKLDYSGAGKKVKRTTTGLQDYPDAGIKVETPTTGIQDHFMVRPQSGKDGKSFRVDTIHISRKSDPYQGTEDKYGGIIIYACQGEGNWSTPNGKHCKSGYVVIMQTDTEKFEKLQEKWNEPGIVHGTIYKEAFGVSCNVTEERQSCTVEVVGEGFSIRNGKFRTVSRAFNRRGKGGIYHDDSYKMSEHSAKCVKKLVDRWKDAGSSFCDNRDHSVESLLSWNRLSFNQQLRDTDYSYSYVAILYAMMRLKIFSYILTLYDKNTRI